MSLVTAAKHWVPERVKHPVRSLTQSARSGRAAFESLLDLKGRPVAAATSLARAAVRPRRTALCYPVHLEPYLVAHRIFLHLEYRVETDPHGRYDFAFLSEPATVYPAPGYRPVRDVPTINRDARDISKRAVERAFCEAFGYALGVDPETFRGPVVRKSDANYAHDAVVLDGPLRVDPAADRADGVTYQRYVDTRTADGYYLDHRVPIYDGEVPLVYLKYHPEGARRFVDVSHSELARPSDAFAADELRGLAEVARRMGVEYGEMDVLRDNADGRIYVVDVNRTPSGPVKGVTQEQRRQALDVLAPAFERMVDRRLAAR